MLTPKLGSSFAKIKEVDFPISPDPILFGERMRKRLDSTKFKYLVGELAIMQLCLSWVRRSILLRGANIKCERRLTGGCQQSYKLFKGWVRSSPLVPKIKWAYGETVSHLFYTQDLKVRFLLCLPKLKWAYGVNGSMVVLHTTGRGSTPRRSTKNINFLC